MTGELIDRLAATPHPDLIADFASQLPVAIIGEILDLPVDMHPRMLEWGHSGAPLLDIGIGWRAYRRAVDGLRGADGELRDRFHQLRSGAPGDNPFSRLAADGTLDRPRVRPRTQRCWSARALRLR